jgi:ABC-type transport system substrate-binding protein
VEAHPVGTGPYRLRSWVRASKIVLEANPEFRGLEWNFDPGKDPVDARISWAMRGKKLPQIGVVEFHVFHEPQSSWLAFKNGNVDLASVPDALVPLALRGDRLAPELETQGVTLSRILEPAITYTASTCAIRWSVDSQRRRSHCDAPLQWLTTTRKRSQSFEGAPRSSCR